MAKLVGSIVRPVEATETLILHRCPVCNGEMEVNWDGDRSPLSPGNMRCRGSCRSKWKILDADSLWHCGEQWNEMAERITHDMLAIKLIAVRHGPDGTEHGELGQRAERLLKKLLESRIGAMKS